MGRVLTKEEVGFYHDNGYLVVNDLFSPEETDRMLEICNRVGIERKFQAALNPDREIPELRGVMKDPRVVSALEALQGAEVVGLMSQIFFKQRGTPFQNRAWNPHQDNAYPQAKDGAYITINIFLHDTDPENGGMYFYAGSHREPVLPFEPVPSYEVGTNPGNTVKVPEKYPKVDVSVPRGGMVFLHGNCIHGSYPNRSQSRDRTLFSCCYITQGEKFLAGNTAKRMEISLK